MEIFIVGSIHLVSKQSLLLILILYLLLALLLQNLMPQLLYVKVIPIEQVLYQVPP